MNVDTDMQYAFTRAVAGQMFKNDDGVLKVDGEVGNKKAYDPRSYLALIASSNASVVIVANRNRNPSPKSLMMAVQRPGRPVVPAVALEG